MSEVSRYYGDIVAFAENEYILPDTRCPITLAEHQKRILGEMFERDERGRFRFDTMIFSAPKKSGKTEIGALVATWLALVEGPFAEIYTPANDLEQSQSRAFRAATRAIQANPRLSSVKAQRDVIAFPDGSEIRTVAADAAGIAGANPTASVWDELWGYTTEQSRRLWDELTPVPTRLNSITFVATYAGFTGESSLLEELYSRGVAGERIFEDLPVYVNGRTICYWDHEARMPWQTELYYRDQRAQLRPGAYARLHRNEWVSSESRFIEPETWDACVDPDLRPLEPTDKRPVIVGVDAATKRDSAAVVGVYRDGDDAVLAFCRVWRPTKRAAVDLNDTVAAYLRELDAKYRIRRVLFDPYQMASIASELRKEGIRMEEFPQTTGNLTEAASTLWDRLTHRSLRVYREPTLREHALNASVIEGPRGMRLSKATGSRKIDSLAALSFALTWVQSLASGDRSPGDAVRTAEKPSLWEDVDEIVSQAFDSETSSLWR